MAFGISCRPPSRAQSRGRLLTEIRRNIDQRLDELRPVRDEFRRLEHARHALATANDSRRTVRATRAKDRSGARMTRAQSQQIDRQVLALLREDSAQRPAALATLTATSVGSMNARLKRLVSDGNSKGASAEVPFATRSHGRRKRPLRGR